MPTSRTSKFLQGVAITAATGVGAFVVWTKHCKVEPLDLPNDKLYKSVFYQRYNPNKNPPMNDVVIRRIPLYKIKPELLKDSQSGGSKLVETFCAGIFSGSGYLVQRKFLETKYRNDATTSHQLWTKPQLQESTYPVGTEMTDHFNVIEKTPTSILLRCGDSPLTSPDGPREFDGLFELSATTDFDTGFAEFRLKTLLFTGVGQTDKHPAAALPGLEWLHRQYTKLWMEGATRACLA